MFVRLNCCEYVLVDFANAHSGCSRGNIWEELEKDTYFHFLIQILNLYGDNCTPPVAFGDGPDQPPTSSGDGLTQE
jgi:hypothetical protein